MINILFMIERFNSVCTISCSYHQQQSEILEDHVDCKNYLTSHSLSSSVQMSEVWQIFFHNKYQGPRDCNSSKFFRPCSVCRSTWNRVVHVVHVFLVVSVDHESYVDQELMPWGQIRNPILQRSSFLLGVQGNSWQFELKLSQYWEGLKRRLLIWSWFGRNEEGLIFIISDQHCRVVPYHLTMLAYHIQTFMTGQLIISFTFHCLRSGHF